MPERSSDVPAQRRFSGGARHEATERVVLKRSGTIIEGWTLNVSRGGLRLVVEDPVEVGAVYEVSVGGSGAAAADETEPARSGRVVWIREEADGQIVGLEYIDLVQSEPPG